MSNWRILATLPLLAALSLPAAQASPFHRKPTSGHARSGHAKKASAKGKHAAKLHGQQAIDSDRARQIQTALVREHYMTAEPTGTWDDATKEAMTRYQADHGCQTRITPDSRALIQLGLGPEQPKGQPAGQMAALPASSAVAAKSTTEAAAPAPAKRTPAPGNTTVQASTQPHTLGSAISAHSSSLQN